MIDYGKQRSTVKPDGLEITETKVFVYSDIEEVLAMCEIYEMMG